MQKKEKKIEFKISFYVRIFRAIAMHVYFSLILFV